MNIQIRTLAAAALAASILLSACGGASQPAATATPVTTRPIQPVLPTDQPTEAATETPAGPIVGAPTFGEAVIDSIEFQMQESFPVQVVAVLKGNMPDGCTKVDKVDQTYDAASKTFTLKVATRKPGGVLCTEVITPYEQNVPLQVSGLAKGTYTVNANGKTATFDLAADNGPTPTP